MIDPLSDLLDFLQARCDLSGRLVAGGTWARRFGTMGSIKFCAITEGRCWCFMEGLPDEPRQLAAGDILVMSGTHTLVLASAPARISGATAMPLARDDDGAYRLGHGSDFTMLSGLVQIDADRQALLLSGLPPLIHVSRATEAAAPISWLIAQLVAETQPGSRPGQATVISGLAQLLFVQTLRAYLAHAPHDDRGWLKGFGDARLSVALRCIHGDPARNWNLEALAKEAGMSRTSFAVRFREMMGVPPLTYLTQWRMHLARRAIRAGVSTAEAAAAVGYSSESAFRSAFKRVMDVAPGQYRRTAEVGDA
ncbi:AraC family transcriptional regulator [Burkholderia sp. 22PA0106]|uniref:AraC family transcriptional regulator n=1 Tax=Burkholderia sp. 22PA0106 TaxID=3237371 RepID=UPI0039C098B9